MKILLNRCVRKITMSVPQITLCLFAYYGVFFMIARKVTFNYLLGTNGFPIMSIAGFSVDIGGMRAEYKKKGDAFTEDQIISKEPYSQFKVWFDEACTTPNILEPNAMCLATSTRSGIPSARYVLLKGYGKDGFKFFTNYNSRKGEELKENPNAALVFYWEPLRRSVRIEGIVEKLSEKESNEYFLSRPKDSQIGAACSNQSQPISSRNILTDREKQMKEQYANSDSIEKPREWGGFILKPHTIEFWQGQSDRLHDRIRFRIPKENEVIDQIILHSGEDGWVYERLQP